jgi:hypothetical protein
MNVVNNEAAACISWVLVFNSFGEISFTRVFPLTALVFLLATPAFIIMTGSEPGKGKLLKFICRLIMLSETMKNPVTKRSLVIKTPGVYEKQR